MRVAVRENRGAGIGNSKGVAVFLLNRLSNEPDRVSVVRS